MLINIVRRRMVMVMMRMMTEDEGYWKGYVELSGTEDKFYADFEI